VVFREGPGVNLRGQGGEVFLASAGLGGGDQDLMGTWQATANCARGFGALVEDRGACQPDPRLNGNRHLMAE